MFSNLFGPMYPRQMYFIILVLFVVLTVFILTVSEDSRLGFPEFDNTSHFFKNLFWPPTPPQFAKPFYREPPFRLQLRECQSAFVGGTGLGVSVQSSAQIRPGRMGQVIIPQIASGKDTVDNCQTRLRSVAHRNGHGAI